MMLVPQKMRKKVMPEDMSFQNECKIVLMHVLDKHFVAATENLPQSKYY